MRVNYFVSNDYLLFFNLNANISFIRTTVIFPKTLSEHIIPSDLNDFSLFQLIILGA